MATVKVKFRKSSVEGKAGSIYYQLCHKQSNRQITTRMHVLSQWWDAEKETFISEADNSEVSARYQRQIEKDLQRIRRILCEWDGTGKDYTLTDVITRFRTWEENGDTVLTSLATLVDEFKNDDRWGNARNLQRALNSFSGFLEGWDVSLKQVDEKLIMEYEQWLRARKVSKNSSSFYMRTLRSAYNKVISRNQMEQTFPFRNVYTGVEHTRKRAVHEDIMICIQKLNLIHSAPLAFSRDLFIFSYCTRGMAFVDIAYLKKVDISGGMLSYVRHKTGQRLTIRIEPCIEEIIKRYEPSVRNSPYLFPIITSDDPEEAFRQYQTALGYHNRKLKKLGKLTGENLRLSSYTARHSWATVARNHNVPLSVISAGMGHTSEKTTLIYLDSIENSLIDKANEGILEALCRNVSK
ncbi:tyrosine-type recombinase/integrase [Bacteroides oleiciplenus]|uniref:Site-specific integrase n=1 Tax=Bacteroides oleiciplenus TaxID=626931 RepID=A0A3E5BRZ0_9BACE|nr:site-specific integrase [Bacteroides oleiciplenus]RGN40384.1 site-specific integrase [Bacteroides oleiciplenus]